MLCTKTLALTVTAFNSIRCSTSLPSMCMEKLRSQTTTYSAHGGRRGRRRRRHKLNSVFDERSSPIFLRPMENESNIRNKKHYETQGLHHTLQTITGGILFFFFFFFFIFNLTSILHESHIQHVSTCVPTKKLT